MGVATRSSGHPIAIHPIAGSSHGKGRPAIDGIATLLIRLPYARVFLLQRYEYSPFFVPVCTRSVRVATIRSSEGIQRNLDVECADRVADKFLAIGRKRRRLFRRGETRSNANFLHRQIDLRWRTGRKVAGKQGSRVKESRNVGENRITFGVISSGERDSSAERFRLLGEQREKEIERHACLRFSEKRGTSLHRRMRSDKT